jgi:hypothetical protein
MADEKPVLYPTLDVVAPESKAQGGDLYDMLEQRHPAYTARLLQWKRYRAFTEGLKNHAEKEAWLEQGEHESDRAYRKRISLTELLGYAKPAVRRMVGGLTKQPFERKNGNARIDEFDKRANKRGQSIASVLKRAVTEGLKMGVSLTLVSRDQVEGAASAAAEPIPFCEEWRVEELTNWGEDAAGVPTWVVLRREVSEQPDPLKPRKVFIVWKVITRETGRTYRAEKPANGQKPQTVETLPEWQHDLGLVPLAPFYAFECGTFQGESYVDDLTLADKRKLGFDSDQGMASYLNGSPQLKMKVAGSKDLGDVAADTSRIIKLDAEKGEDAEYLEITGSGMEVREKIIESTIRQGFNLAGIDPSSVMSEDGPTAARSGVSLAWSFSTAEQPTLSQFTDELDKTDLLIHEIVARYLAPRGTRWEAGQQAYTAQIQRVKSWDMLAVDRAVSLGEQAWDRIPSKEWRRNQSKFLAQAIPGNLTPDLAKRINEELDKEDFEDPEEPELMPNGRPRAA